LISFISKERRECPSVAYNISGEYAMIKAAAEKVGSMRQSDHGNTDFIKRAGADSSQHILQKTL
jgi:delta-aminolevulinic acid dehydratase/porphobilinogen synthase